MLELVINPVGKPVGVFSTNLMKDTRGTRFVGRDIVGPGA
jgi:hypothetical protein